MSMHLTRIVCLALALLASGAPGECRTILDMDGRRVTLSDEISRIVTIGPVPVLNGFLFAFGRQQAIANGLPRELTRKYQFVFAPDLATRPVVQSSAGLAVEDIVALRPDLVLTMDRSATDKLSALGLPAVLLKWREPDDVKTLMRLLGEILDERKSAEDYIRYFDETLARVATTLGPIEEAQRPRVLYVNYRRLTQPHRIAEWWMARAGGHSVTDDRRTEESVTFSLEQMIGWNPEVVIVPDRAEVELVKAEPRLRDVAAVRNGRVHVAPGGAHLWANRTIEQPLTVLWAASILYPEKFPRAALENEMRSFYDRFFHVPLGKEQIDEILADSPGR
ncbi:ABC transporter substrate-binding protein (plasmid) [Methylosinus sp. C49]|jgi:iron complex transport system substrate-binding protein|uniref:ABC transporter substrate-binding protein n=1 Tax=Methylosinus sp. C49 TaxID=2699395 RepID=UPI001366CAFF|nr:ABC transporter substrate-binding protein [Methylosinus sp. C49]BBU63846.1 ABC transporter substrate-binding protein [Methylosinus sp. C49]